MMIIGIKWNQTMQFQNSAAAIFIFVILNILPKTLMPQFLNLKKKNQKTK